MKRIIDFFRAHHKFIVVAHVDPDGDSCSSVLAVDWLLRAWGKKTALVAKQPLPRRFRFLPGIERFRSGVPQKFRPDAAVVLDTPRRDRIGSDLPAGIPVVNIDHHFSNRRFGDYNWIEGDRSSTSEILHRLIRKAGEPLDRKIAFIIFTGMYADTGGFRHPNTSPQALAVAARLLRFGFTADEVNTGLNATSPANLKLLARVLGTLETKNGIASIHLSLRMRRLLGVGPDDCDSDNFIRHPMMIRGVRLAMFFREEGKNLTRVSFRSRGGVDVDRLARSLGGGGHKNAAAVKLGESFVKAKRKVWKATERFLAGGDS